MKLRHIALAAAAVASGQAFAVDLPASAQAKLYVAGSSAIAPVLAGIFTQNCAPADLTIYSSKAGAGAFTADTSNGASHNVYYCASVSGTDFGAAYVGKSIAVWKRDAGGSGVGVFPVATNTSVGMLDTSDTSCDVSHLCTAEVLVKPDAGVSDLEPVAFNSAVNRPTAFATAAPVATSNFGTSQSVAEVVFGIVANNRLFNQLAADQATTTPSISSAMFTSIFSQGWVDSGLGWSPLTATAITNQINICSRAIGSGTRATAQIQFIQSPNNKLAQAFETPAANTSTTKGGNTAGALLISEESSSGNVVSCVELAETVSNGYAVGIASADRDLSAKNAKFLYLDNQNPNRVAAKEGKYPWVFEEFYQTNKTVRNAGGGASAFDNSLFFANAFRDAFKKPSNINAIPAAAKNGVMAVPSSCNADRSAWTTDEQAVCSRVSRSGDSRLPLTFQN